MALEKPYEFHGVPFNGAYHRVTHLFVNVDQNIARITVRVYKNKQARIDDPETYLSQKTFFLAKPGSDTKVADFIGQPLDLRAVVYNELKKTDFYNSATDA